MIGAWKLESYEERPVDGSAPFHPLSDKPMGIIMYTPDGYMSAQLMQQNRKNFESGDWFDGTDAEYKQEASTYIAYSGPFQVDEEKQTMTHSMSVSLFPNWTGQTQPRVFFTPWLGIVMYREGDADLFHAGYKSFHILS